MTHDPLDDPMLDGLDRWHATAGTYSLDGTYIPDGTYVRLDDLPDLIARVRADERGKNIGTVSLGELAKAQEHTYNAGYAAALRDAVEAVKAVYAPQWGTYSGLCIHADAVAAIEALGGEQ